MSLSPNPPTVPWWLSARREAVVDVLMNSAVLAGERKIRGFVELQKEPKVDDGF